MTIRQVEGFNNWTVEFCHPEPASDSTFEPLSVFNRTMIELEQSMKDMMTVQPMTGECGSIFRMRYESTMTVEVRPSLIRIVVPGLITMDAKGAFCPPLAESEIPPVD